MANGYNPDLGLTSLSDLLQIINYVGGGNKQQNYGSLFNMHAEHLGSYDNDEIDRSVANINSYLDKYRDKMEDVEIEQYDLMLDKYSQQKTRNENYQTDYDLFATRYNDGILELGEDYVNATSATSWSYTDDAGHLHEMDFPDWEALGYDSAKDPEFLKSTEYIDFVNKHGGPDKFADVYIAARNDYKIHVKNKLEDEFESFVKGKQKFERDYADRLGSGVYRNDALNLEEMKFTYGFLLDSIEDGVLDTEERKAYEDALMRSEVTPITDFNAKTGEVRRISRQMTMDNMVNNVNNADMFNNHLNQFHDFLDVDMTQVNPNNPYMTIPGELVGQDKDDPVTLTYQQVYDYASAINPTPEMLADPVYNYLTSVGGLLEQTKSQLQQQDENLIKNSGASFINTLHGKDWLDDVRPGGVGFVPAQPTITPTTDDDVDSDDNDIDDSQDAQNISAKNQRGITTGNKININYESPSQVQPKKDGVTLIPYPGAKSTFIKNEHLPEYHNPTIVDKDSLIQAVFNKTNKPVVGHDGPGETLDAFLLTYNPRIRKKITKLLRKFWKLNDNKKIKEANAIGQEILSFINQIDKNKKMKYPVIGYTAGMIGQP